MNAPIGRYSKVSRRMWGDAKVRHLSSAPPNGQTLWVRLLTGPELTNIPGLFPAWESGLAQALGWDLKGFREAFREVSAEGLAKADWEVGLVFVPNAIEHNKPASPNVVRSWKVAWAETPECDLKSEAYQILKAFMKGLGKGFEQAFAEACADPLANQYQYQKQKQYQKEEKREASATPTQLFSLGEPTVPIAQADEHQAVFDAWVEARRRRFPELRKARTPVLDSKRRAIIDKAIREGHELATLILAAEGICVDSRRMEAKACKLEWALENADAIEEHALRAQQLRDSRSSQSGVHPIVPESIEDDNEAAVQ